MTMRITGGEKSGLRLSTFPKNIIRPTRDMVREAVFNTLGDSIRDASFLDIFAGTGSTGIEALSRGASDATFIENERRAADVIKKNLAITGFEGQSLIMAADYVRALKKLSSRKAKFAIIYVDPPYQSGFYDRCIRLIDEGELLIPNGILIAESFKKMDLLHKFGYIELTREKLYGETRISYYINTKE